MLTELQEYVPYSTALKLHTLGYTNEAHSYYNIYNKHIFFSNDTLHSEAIWAPTYEQVYYWLINELQLETKPNKEDIIESINKISKKI